MKNIYYVNPEMAEQSWAKRHMLNLRACLGPQRIRYNHLKGAPVIAAIDTWIVYAIAHQVRFESKIGDDYVLGPAWARWGFALRELLNGDMGAADCGTLDTILCDNLAEQGFNPDDGAP